MRSMASATIVFGMVSIPVRQFNGHDTSGAVSFKKLAGDGAPLKQKMVHSLTGEPVEASEQQRGYEVAKGEYVTFTDAEIAATKVEATRQIDILEFVPADAVDRRRVSKSYFLAASKSERSYSLLCAALSKARRVAIGTYAANGHAQLVALRPVATGKGKRRRVGIIMEYIARDAEMVDAERVFDESGTVDAGELALALQIIDSKASPHLTASAEPCPVAVAQTAMIEAKAKAAGTQTPPSNVVDLGAALLASVQTQRAKAAG